MIKKTIEDLEKENLAACNSILKVDEFIKATGQEVRDVKQWCQRMTEIMIDINHNIIQLNRDLITMNNKITSVTVNEE